MEVDTTMSYDIDKKEQALLADELEISKSQLETVKELMNDGNTIPFLARYRKEQTGGLDENKLREVQEKLDYFSRLQEKKNEVKEKIADQDKLSPELKNKIDNAETLQEVDDIYFPYKSRRKTRADKAREKGLKPLADLIIEQKADFQKLKEEAKGLASSEEELSGKEEALEGAKDILADRLAADPDLKELSRLLCQEESRLVSRVKNEEKDEKGVYEQYYDFSQCVQEIPPFRVLALNRGEEEDILSVKVEHPREKITTRLEEEIIDVDSTVPELLKDIIDDAFRRLQGPALAREIRSRLTEKAEAHAREIFSKNVEALLMQSPMPDKTILGIDPAFRTGCKLAAIDQEGSVIETGEIYPHPPQGKWDEALKKLGKLIEDYGVDVIALGNGTASRETDRLLSELNEMTDLDVPYTIVSEDGASVYSASELAGKELPELDVSMRGAVSIARRLQDPLAELVKIDPRSLGVGLYQHDIDEKALLEELEVVVESAVNRVGVDLNTASPALLSYVAGINSAQSSKIFDHRENNGPFTERKQLLEVKGIGPKTFEQAAGFLRLYSPEDPLARTPIHPESYEAAEMLFKKIDFSEEKLISREEEIKQELREKLRPLVPRMKEIAEELDVGLPTLRDIISSLQAPDRDPRSQFTRPIFRTEIKELSDINEGEVLPGTVRNVVDFGAFVDVGLKVDGLIHISELAEHYVDDPLQVVSVGDTVKVKVLEVDERRERISLSRRGI